MIVSHTFLISARGADRDESLCRVEIANIDDRGSRADYVVRLYARNSGRQIREARVINWPKNARPAWRLVAAAMRALEEV